VVAARSDRAVGRRTLTITHERLSTLLGVRRFRHHDLAAGARTRRVSPRWPARIEILNARALARFVPSRPAIPEVRPLPARLVAMTAAGSREKSDAVRI